MENMEFTLKNEIATFSTWHRQISRLSNWLIETSVLNNIKNVEMEEAHKRACTPAAHSTHTHTSVLTDTHRHAHGHMRMDTQEIRSGNKETHRISEMSRNTCPLKTTVDVSFP